MPNWKRNIALALVLVGFIVVPMSDETLDAQSPCPKGMVCLFKVGTTEILEKVPDIGPLLIKPVPFDKKAELGKLLFCDHRLSADNKYACAQCHQPLQGFTVALPLPLGVGGLVAGFRNSPSLYNLDYVDNTGIRSRQHILWDGRAESLEHQLTALDLSPTKAPSEQGMKDAESIMKKLADLKYGHPDTNEYKAKFKQAFQSAPDITSLAINDLLTNFSLFVDATVAYERTLISVESPFDLYARQYLKNHPEGLPSSGAFKDFGIEKFKEEQWKGMLVFRGNGRCIFCHSGPNFTDNKFHNVGWPAERQADGNWKYQLKNDDVIDPGRYCKTYGMHDGEADDEAVVDRHHDLNPVRVCKQYRSNKATENGAFKTPTLRSVEQTWPYMHDGAMPNFEDLRTELDEDKKVEKALRPVIEFFNKGGGRDNNKFVDPLMQKLDLTEEDMSNLVAFLRSLTGKTLDDKITNNCPFPPIGSS
jgi:cytochrome c peroxidase